MSVSPIARLRKMNLFVSRIPLRLSLIRLKHSRSLGPEYVTADAAVSVISSLDTVYVHGVSAIPKVLLAALEKRSEELTRVEFMHLHLSDNNPCATEEHGESFFTNNLFIGGNQRKLVENGYSSVLFLSFLILKVYTGVLE
jgi:hypothetical protein